MDNALPYRQMRLIIGAIPLTLSAILLLSTAIFQVPMQPSISEYYYTPMRDLFVSSLAVTGFFLAFYKGYEKCDETCSKIASAGAVGTAFFRCDSVEPSLTLRGLAHYVSASLLFLAMIYFCLFLFVKSSGEMTPGKKIRNTIYRTCGIGMVLSIGSILVHKITGIGPTMFWSETVMLILFGISWHVKGIRN